MNLLERLPPFDDTAIKSGDGDRTWDAIDALRQLVIQLILTTPQSSFLGGLRVLKADPGDPKDGEAWIRDDQGTPASVALRYRKGGATYSIAEITI